MGKRGPQPGFKRARADAAAAAPAPVAPVEHAQAEPGPRLTYEERNNPKYLSGQALRDFAHARGVPRSSMDSMTDDKIRCEVGFLIARQYDDPDDPEG